MILTSLQSGCISKPQHAHIPETGDLLCREAATGQAWISLWLKLKNYIFQKLLQKILKEKISHPTDRLINYIDTKFRHLI
jgi:hypothetical protein